MFVGWLLEALDALDALEGLGLFQNRVQSYNIFLICANKKLFFVGDNKKLDGIEDVLPNDICRSAE